MIANHNQGNWRRLSNCAECDRPMRGACEVELCADCLNEAISETVDGLRIFNQSVLS